MGEGIFVQDIPQQTLHVFLANTLAGMCCGRKVQFDVPQGLINGSWPETVSEIVVLRYAPEQFQVGLAARA